MPLGLIVARYAITRWNAAATRVIVAMLAIVVVLLLGAHLHIVGVQTIPLPWKLLDHWLLAEVVPLRLGLFMFLIVGVITAMWLAQSSRGRWGLAKWSAAAVGIVFVLPNIGTGLWHSSPPNPAFFTTHEYRSVLRRGETVLVLPYGYQGFSMLWLADTGMRFQMTGGYLNPAPPADYARDALYAALTESVKPNPPILREFLIGRGVSAVIAGPGTTTQWAQALDALGMKPMSIGGILYYRVRGDRSPSARIREPRRNRRVYPAAA